MNSQLYCVELTYVKIVAVAMEYKVVLVSIRMTFLDIHLKLRNLKLNCIDKQKKYSKA